MKLSDKLKYLREVEGVIPAATFRLSEEEFSEIQNYLSQHVA